jgi:hypothetical protein
MQAPIYGQVRLPFARIEDRLGPNYRASVEDVAPPDESGVKAIDVIVALLIPLAGLYLAICRFAENYVGPGIALLLISTIGFGGWLMVGSTVLR